MSNYLYRCEGDQGREDKPPDRPPGSGAPTPTPTPTVPPVEDDPGEDEE